MFVRKSFTNLYKIRIQIKIYIILFIRDLYAEVGTTFLLQFGSFKENIRYPHKILTYAISCDFIVTHKDSA